MSKSIKLNKGLVQQGDVLIVDVDEIPKGAKRKANNIIAEGEVTGHKHVLDGGGAVLEHEGALYLDVHEDGAKVIHDDHHTATLTKGFKKIEIVREKDHLSGLVSPVRD